jgi:hypothetical protein
MKVLHFLTSDNEGHIQASFDMDKVPEKLRHIVLDALASEIEEYLKDKLDIPLEEQLEPRIGFLRHIEDSCLEDDEQDEEDD